jgi:hypothetical protein
MMREELNELKREYGSMLKSITVNDYYGIIVTLEGHTFQVYAQPAGWMVDGGSKRYETSESMLMALSPIFQEKWHQELANRLHALSSK